ncbi:FliM/FliN family flagellar motor switch protein [Bradyrhizobium genosp. P]|uniref:FliM/FliN family flagellar motor switch protein n=1 Tax=Bradyrhizobium genosp. P TaxID=83641 RepID=UPI003CF363E6
MINLPFYSRCEAAAVSQIAARLPVAFSLGSIKVQAVMTDWGLPRLPADTYTVAMHARGHNIRLALGSALVPQMAVERWPEITALPPAHGLAEIWLDIVLRDLAVEVEQWCGQRPTWSCLNIAESRPYALKLVRQEPPNDLVGLVEFDAGGLQWIADCCSDLPVMHAPLDDLPLHLDMRIARISVVLADLQQLAQGDVILLDHSPVGQDGEMAVVMYISDSPRFRASILNCRLSVLTAVECLMGTPEPLPPESFDSVNLTVDVDVGRLTMPLRQLRELAVGQVLDLGFDATTNVCLRVNGQVVATGELVRIAERTGVRLLDLRLRRAER